MKEPVTEKVADLLAFGWMDWKAGYPEYARQYFEQVLVLDPENTEAKKALAAIERNLSGNEEEVKGEQPVAEGESNVTEKVEMPCVFCKEPMDIDASTCPHCGKTAGLEYVYVMRWGIVTMGIAVVINIVLGLRLPLISYWCSLTPWIIIAMAMSIALMIGGRQAEREKERIRSGKVKQGGE